MIVGGYELHLYCEHNAIQHGDVSDALGHRYDEFPHTFYAETGAETRTAARKAGWRLDLNEGHAFCPKCTTKRKPPAIK